MLIPVSNLLIRDYLLGFDDGMDSAEEELFSDFPRRGKRLIGLQDDNRWLGLEGLWIIFTIEYFQKVGK